MEKEIKNIEELYDLAGSTTKLAASLTLHASTVERWGLNGIPKKYRSVLRDIYGISDRSIDSINKKIKAKHEAK